MAQEPPRRIARAVAETARQFGTPDLRVAGTIWWYMNCGNYALADQRTVIDELAEVSGASPQALWAIASDDLAKQLLASGNRDAKVESPLLAPRFVEVAGRWFVKRQSCCLIYETPQADLCLSCPKHLPAERERLLEEFVRRSR
ncbi:(2Fe-2S)-binding protein [Smaragdicoccus niigatensis]|uniref:(2Fe-2S)-binding protein n=1 Tax=Smaragdicoccus niigatensis TaxID=359359 RepID=UPI000368FB1E|nr:(2Fe-2S)-binding protein [Smaragdicoccus niigatensis]